MEKSYNDKIKLLMENAKKYENFPLADFIRNTLLESGFSADVMENVYIDEIVNYPEIFGCYKNGDKIVTYSTNSHGEKFIKEYDDSAKFMLVFLRTANISQKYPEKPKKK